MVKLRDNRFVVCAECKNIIGVWRGPLELKPTGWICEDCKIKFKRNKKA